MEHLFSRLASCLKLSQDTRHLLPFLLPPQVCAQFALAHLHENQCLSQACTTLSAQADMQQDIHV